MWIDHPTGPPTGPPTGRPTVIGDERIGSVNPGGVNLNQVAILT